MNYLEICQRVARQSGTVASGPVSVDNQEGRLSKIVDWVRIAWTNIQASRESWHFLDGFFEGDNVETIPNAATYTANSWDIPEFGRFLLKPRTLIIHDPAIGKKDDQYLYPIPWDNYQGIYQFGEEKSGRPTDYSVGPNGALHLGPTPNKGYRIRGAYLKAPQVLKANEDIPQIAERFHDIIVWYALILMSEHDEGYNQAVVAREHYNDLLTDLIKDQTPRFEFGEPLA